MEKENLQVLYIITKLELGGAQKVCLSLFEGLKNHTNDVYLVSGCDGTLADQVKSNSHVHLLPDFKREISLGMIILEIKNFIRLTNHIRALHKQHPNLIVHTHSTKAGLIGRWAAFFAGVKKRIHTVHGYHFHTHQSWPVWLISYALELFTSFITTRYICVSSADVTYGIALLPFFKQKYSIIRAAVAWEKFYIAAKKISLEQEKPFVIGTVACFKKQKNISELLRAFAQAHKENPHLKLEIIGDGDLRKTFETWIDQNNLSSAITLHGWQKEVNTFMKQWHVFALTSLWEGLPCAIVEARLMKLPVFAYNTGGIHDVIIHKKNGFLYNHHDWQKMGEDLVKISTDKELYTQLSLYQDDLSAFHDKRMLQEHITLYENS